jgi:predicted DNA binding CopG/RHH family protein
MSKRIAYTDEPMELEVIEDFLPPPGALVRKEDTVKVTLHLSRASVDFFKRHARRSRTPYQRMIRRLLDLYAAKHQG